MDKKEKAILQLRIGTAQDIPAVVLFRNKEADHTEYVTKTSTREEKLIYNKYSTGGSAYFIVEENGIIVGNSILLIKDSEGHIGRLIVDHDKRGMGIGKMLLEASLARCRATAARKCRLLVNPKNDAAIHLYQKFGFVQFGNRFNIDGEELDRMICVL